jgi:hypothetical protein
MNSPTPTLLKIVVSLIIVGIALLGWAWLHAHTFSRRPEHASRLQAHAAP